MKRVSNSQLFLLFILLIAAGCNRQGFKANEYQLINAGAGNEIMRLFIIDNTSDSLLLRQDARRLKKRHLDSETFSLLKSRMLATVNDSLNRGVGIAAPQVGVSVRLIAVQRLDKAGEPFGFYINPEILAYGDSIKSGREGCLSIPHYRGMVERAQSIVLDYTDEQGIRQKEEISGFTAVIFQHEIDHINGVLYFDHIQNGFNALTHMDEP